jgi:hypothetical protein
MRHSKLATFSPEASFDALRLRLLLSNILNHATRVNTAMQEACPRVLETIDNGTLHCWKQLGSITEKSGPSELELSIEGWRDSLRDIGGGVYRFSAVFFVLLLTVKSGEGWDTANPRPEGTNH